MQALRSCVQATFTYTSSDWWYEQLGEVSSTQLLGLDTKPVHDEHGQPTNKLHKTDVYAKVIVVNTTPLCVYGAKGQSLLSCRLFARSWSSRTA